MVAAFSRAVSKLWAQARTIGMGLVGFIAHRLEGYMSSMGRDVSPVSVDDYSSFVICYRRVLGFGR